MSPRGGPGFVELCVLSLARVETMSHWRAKRRGDQ